MIGPLDWIDFLFLATIVLLIFNGLRNGFVFSLFNLLSLPAAFIVAKVYGPQFTVFLANNGLPATPIISYIVLFFGTVLVLHIIGTVIRGIVRVVPLVGLGDTLLGGLVGFVEAWLLWLILLILLGDFLHSLQNAVSQGNSLVPGLNISVDQLQRWHDYYNTAVTNSLFARVNSIFVKTLPALPKLSHFLRV